MTETVIPATCVEVRAEGLASAGGVGAGVVGVVGTAADEFGRPFGEVPLTLVRALELVYVHGASAVVAVRVAGEAGGSAAFVVKNASGGPVATLTARHPGPTATGLPRAAGRLRAGTGHVPGVADRVRGGVSGARVVGRRPARRERSWCTRWTSRWTGSPRSPGWRRTGAAEAARSELGATHLLLAKHFGWTPEQVSALTPGKVAVYLAGVRQLVELDGAGVP